MSRKLLALSLGIAAALVFGELLTRVVHPQPKSWLDIYRRHPRLPFYSLAPNVDERMDTGETEFHVRTDAAGRRISRERAADAGADLALVLGDSFTFAQGVDHEQSFVGRLDAMAEVSLHLVNTGVPGYGPTQYRMLLEEQLERGPEPQLVLVASYLGNDYHDCVWDKDQPVVDGTLTGSSGLRAIVKRRSHLYRLLSRTWHRLRPGEHAERTPAAFDVALWEQPPLVEARRIFEQEFLRIEQLCAEHAIPLVVCLLPPRLTLLRAGTPPDGLDYGLPGRIATEFLSGLDLSLVDTSAALLELGPERAVFVSDGHLTPAGHQVVAEALLSALVAR